MTGAAYDAFFKNERRDSRVRKSKLFIEFLSDQGAKKTANAEPLKTFVVALDTRVDLSAEVA
jgi:hypothetical protein